MLMLLYLLGDTQMAIDSISKQRVTKLHNWSPDEIESCYRCLSEVLLYGSQIGTHIFLETVRSKQNGWLF